MSNILSIIEERKVLGQDFRIYGDYDNPLFLAKDIATWIEHTDLSRMVNMVDREEKLKRTLYVSGQNREMWFLNEDGLYEVLMQSRKPIAKKFKKEVKVILKDIRKHGIYATNKTLDNILLNPDFGIKLLTRYKFEKEKNEQLEAKIANDKPYVDFSKSIEVAKNSIPIGDYAKVLQNDYNIKIGRNRLFDWFRRNDYLIKDGRSKNLPKQLYLEQGLFQAKENIGFDCYGNELITIQTLITGKGQVYFADKIKQTTSKKKKNYYTIALKS